MTPRSRTNAEHGSVVVVNPGTHPEPRAIAAAFARLGYEVTYFTGASLPSSSWKLKLLKRIGRTRFSSLNKRVLPEDFSNNIKVKVHGLLLELLFQAAKNRFPHISREIMVTRSRHVSRKAAAHVRAARGAPAFVVAQQTAGARVFRASKSSKTVLLQPIASQRWLENRLGDEASQNPQWAFALQGLDRSPRQLKDMRDEADSAGVFVAGSDLVARTLRGDGLGPSIVQHYGVSAEFQQAERRRRSFDENRLLRAIFVGQVNQRKGISYLLEAMSRLQGVATLDIHGYAGPAVRSRIDSMNLTNVRLCGTASHADLLKIYTDSDLLVLPTLGEGFSLVVPEAMSTGLPCIVSEYAGSHEVITDGVDGFVVPAQDADAIVARILKVRNSPTLLRSMSRRAQQVGRQLTWEAFGDGVCAALMSGDTWRG